MVLVEQREQINVERLVRPERSAGAGEHSFDKIAVVGGGVLRAGADFVLVALGRPAGLGHHHRNVVVLEILHGRKNGVELGFEEVRVAQPGAGIDDVGVRRSEERVVEGDVAGVGGVGEERVRIDHEKRRSFSEKL